MANKTEFSRLVWKRSTVVGVEPTIPTATTIDNTWLDTDILIGEGFLNVADDKFWFRTNNGITEINLSGVSSNNYYTELAYMSGNTLVFDRNDTVEAYSVDLSQFTGGTSGGTSNALPLSGGTMTGGITGTTLYLTDTTGLSATGYIGIDANGQLVGATTPIASVTGNTTMEELSATTISILNSGATARNYVDHSSNLINTNVTNSSIVGGSGNTINTNLRNVFVSGVDLTATANDTAYFSNLNIGGAQYVSPLGYALPLSGGTMTGAITNISLSGVGSGTSLHNLGLDASGFIVTGSTTEELWLSGSAGSYSIRANNSTALSTGNYSFVGGTSSGSSEHVLVFGSLNNASGTTTLIHGDVNTSGAQYGTLLGGQHSTLGNYTFAQGFNHEIKATTNHSAILGGSGNVIESGVDRSVVLGGTGLSATTDDTVYVENLNVAGSTTGLPTSESFAVSDETTAITSGTSKLIWYAPYAMTVTDVYASLSLSGSGASVFDINKNGTTILSTKITVDANEFHSNDAGTPPVISVSSVAQFDKISFDIDTAGATAAGAKIYITGTRT